MKDDKLKQLYFSHDIFADKDEKIVKTFYHFRKNIEEFSDDFIRKNFFHASFGLFWEIVQYLHRNELTVDEIPMLADELRADGFSWHANNSNSNACNKLIAINNFVKGELGSIRYASGNQGYNLISNNSFGKEPIAYENTGKTNKWNNEIRTN